MKELTKVNLHNIHKQLMLLNINMGAYKALKKIFKLYLYNYGFEISKI